jgi:ABC-type transport system substrate-binding protein
MRTANRSIPAVLLVVALLAIALPLAAQTRGGTLVMAYQGNTIPEVDPHTTSNIAGHIISELISDPLLRYDSAAEMYVPVLATSWDISEDGLSYVFHLRDGVLFHNGVTLTADAVKQSFERIRNPDNAMYGAGLLAPVAQIEVLDDLTVQLTLSGVFPDFLANLDRLWILEPNSFAELGDDDFVAGCGPFKVIPSEYRIDESILLEKFVQYWGGEPYLDYFEIRLLPDMATALIELERGEIDLIEFVAGKDIPRLEALGCQPYFFGRINWDNVAFNLSTVTEVELRRAMCYALDAQAILDGVYGGLGEVQRGMGYPGTWLENTEIAGYEYDPAEANRILDAAGWFDTDGDGIREIDGENIDLYFPTRNSDEWSRATQMIQLMYREVGIGTHITMAERMPFYDQVRNGDYDIAWWLSNDSAEPPIALYSWDNREYWCISQVETPVLQLLIEAAESEGDQDKRAAYYKEIQRIFYEDAYMAPGFWSKQAHIGSPSLRGFQVSSLGVAFDAHAWWKASD